jgi:hypothetical protein
MTTPNPDEAFLDGVSIDTKSRGNFAQRRGVEYTPTTSITGTAGRWFPFFVSEKQK